MRKEFEAWARTNHPSAPFLLPNAWQTWQAAYRAGQEAMRERAAQEVVNCTDFAHEELDIWMQETIASAIRALSVE